MAFYIGEVGNKNEGFSQIREWLTSEIEVNKFLCHIKKEGQYVTGFKKAENLAELLYETTMLSDSIEDIAVKNYNNLIKRYDEEIIKKVFPNEILNEEFYKNIEEFNKELEIEYHESFYKKTNYDFEERGQDINQNYSEDSDSGFWHIARDNS